MYKIENKNLMQKLNFRGQQSANNKKLPPSKQEKTGKGRKMPIPLTKKRSGALPRSCNK